MERDNVSIGDGPLPQCAQVRAVEHERQRTQALVLVERNTCANPSSQGSELPHLPVDVAPVPSLLESRLPVPGAGTDKP
jgi:hypothetical protein